MQKKQLNKPSIFETQSRHYVLKTPLRDTFETFTFGYFRVPRAT